MRKLFFIMVCLGILAFSGTAIAEKRKPPSSAIFKISYDGECVNYIVHAYGTHHDQFQLSIRGYNIKTKKTKGFGGSSRFRLPNGQTKDGIKGEICTNIPNYRDRQNVRINAVLMKNGTIVHRKSGTGR